MIPTTGTRNNIMIHARVAEGFFLSRKIIVSAMIILNRKSPMIKNDMSRNVKENMTKLKSVHPVFLPKRTEVMHRRTFL
ncbi:MAG: hypothetical protein PHE94_02060 [Eubacteriales bacterium]|nr:hypothetical protein [Eubacteriales bacterium]